MLVCLIIALIFLVFIYVLWYTNDHLSTVDTFIAPMLYPTNYNFGNQLGAKPCENNGECGKNEFCYGGYCWLYWDGMARPWNNCRLSNALGCKNPKCKCVNCKCGDSCKCEKGGDNSNFCNPFCKKIETRQPSSSLQADCYPICGSPCRDNNDCAPGCPECNNGLCTAPHGTVIL